MLMTSRADGFSYAFTKNNFKQVLFYYGGAELMLVS